MLEVVGVIEIIGFFGILVVADVMVKVGWVILVYYGLVERGYFVVVVWGLIFEVYFLV